VPPGFEQNLYYPQPFQTGYEQPLQYPLEWKAIPPRQFSDFYKPKTHSSNLLNDQIHHLILAIKKSPELVPAIEKLLFKEVGQLESRLPVLLFSIDGLDPNKHLDADDLRMVLGV